MFDTGASPVRLVSPVSTASSAEVTAGHDISTINRTLDISFVHDDSHLMDCGLKHWIRVTQLSPTTTSKSLKLMFYPYGGDEAFVFWDNGVVGYVGFENKYMADLGVEKMNAFIPCGQTQALCVSRVTLDEVIFAKSAAPLCGQKSLTSLLYSDCPVKLVTQFFVTHREPFSCISELVEEVKRGLPQVVITRTLSALVGLKRSWVFFEEFRESLLVELLRQIVNEDLTSFGANCGTFLGNLFLFGFLTGDPFSLASSVLQGGVHSASQVDNICAIAHVCASMPLPIAKASFWALVGQLSVTCVFDTVRAALRGHMRKFQHNTELLSSVSPSTPKNSWSQAKGGDVVSKSSSLGSRSRTLYISHLSPLMPQQAFMELLSLCGTVNKVRVCRGSAHTTLFAFVEMSTAEEAKAVMRLSRMNFFGSSISVQLARNPIQDSQAEDAAVDVGCTAKHGCLFGHRGGLLADAAISCGKSTNK